MGKTEEDWNGLKLGFLKTNAQETYLFVSDLWFCQLHVISLLKFIAIEGE